MKKWLLAAIFPALAGNAAAQAESLYAAGLTDLEGRPAMLEPLRGKPLIVNFWARWCAPCRDEIPELLALHDRLGAKGLAVVGIALDDNLPNAREFAAAYDMRYANYAASHGGIELLRSLGNVGAVLPYTLVVDRDGKVIGRKAGPMSRDELERWAALLLERR